MNRREFLMTAAASAALGKAAAGEEPTPRATMRLERGTKRRTSYFNDARHFWLYAFEPPMETEEAWWPIDELAGTSINTFIYGVETEGLWSDTKVAYRANSKNRPFRSAHGWRAWHNMQSLIDQGLDPLRVLIDRAHERGLEFITSMRMNAGPRDPRYYIGVEAPAAGGGGPMATCHDFARAPVRDVRFTWLEELASYPVEGVELDFAFSPYYFKPQEIEAQTPVMTEYVRKIAHMVRSKGKDRILGVRVFPTVEMNRRLGLDVEAWLKERIVDYVAPLYYGYFDLDPMLPLGSLVQAARGTGAEVYPLLHPFHLERDDHATPAMIRAAVANYFDQGADGMIVGPWFYWPFRDAEKAFLTDLGDPQDVKEKDKHYFVPHRSEQAANLGYDHALPIQFEKPGPAARGDIPFHIADDFTSPHVDRVRLCVRINNAVTQDRFTFKLNGESLANERLRRTTHRYEFLWFEFDLERVRPRHGKNVLSVALEERPQEFVGSAEVAEVEVLVERSHPRSYYDRPDKL